MTTNTPDDLKYTKEHEWVRDKGDGTVTVGITDHAQDELGDLVFVELPEVGRRVAAGEACALVESVKAASDIYSPLDGEVTEVNTVLGDAPETINDDPYGAGWLFKLRLSDASQPDGLLNATEYRSLVEEEG
ncbi:glycine cleavage system protein GcvH [Candidatus Thiosymbion oneisti]|uniref:glycine cleavage system protein GcvH n=1 Tax=Candidatus Thiosymbion oneisti TaxID=589554 RepID=UPI000AB1A77F|nr:glycine cleavage system protein GcvH [Candidatus Thiosymbion oneisti]